MGNELTEKEMAPLKMLRVAKAAEMLGVSKRHLERQIGEGRLPVYRFGKTVRIALNDLKVYIATAKE